MIPGADTLHHPALPPAFEAQSANTADVSQSAPRYDVALSFAGEQRVFVHQVAGALRDAGVAVFYDEFADLWGKDLPKELERVYRKDARYVVVFVSREYIDKAWPNLERQQALAGRIERMDDSVLPQDLQMWSSLGYPTPWAIWTLATAPQPSWRSSLSANFTHRMPNKHCGWRRG